MNKYTFNNEVEVGKYLSSLDIIPDAFRAISESTLTYELNTSPSGINVLAFKCLVSDYTARFLDGEFGLVSSENLQVVDFIPTKLNKVFCINKAVIELFKELSDDLKELENKHVNTRLVITGSGLGGYLAILSALRLQQAIDVEESNGSKNTKRPICITFGSPLVGNDAFLKAISERPQWKSSFLNVVSKKDPVASFLSSDISYKPLGTYLFCNESGGHAAFQDGDSVLAVLNAMRLSNAENNEIYDYGNVLSSIRRKVLYQGVSELGEFNLNPLKAGFTLQLREVGMLNEISHDQINKMEEKQVKLIRSKRNVYEPTKKLNDMKISLTFMEWYMKTRKEKGGYYDCYKNPTGREENTSQGEVIKHKGRLNHYWKSIVKEKNLMPQKEGSKLRKRWLFGGTNYRRIIEPLDIAEYYNKGIGNYMDKENRHEHYTLLEKWSNEEKESNLSEEKRNKAASLTEDSCFWAHVEEALLLLNDLKNGGSGYNEGDNVRKLKEFEDKLMREIKGYTVSPDVFVSGCSLMKWWNEYKEYKGSSYVSEFTEYMNNKTHGSYK